jgi:hypothetical protein
MSVSLIYAQTCLRMAAECRVFAAEAPTPELRAHFLRMTGMWEQFAVDGPPDDPGALN